MCKTIRFDQDKQVYYYYYFIMISYRHVSASISWKWSGRLKKRPQSKKTVISPPPPKTIIHGTRWPLQADHLLRLLREVLIAGLRLVGWCQIFLLRGCDWSEGVEYTFWRAVIGQRFSIGQSTSEIVAGGSYRGAAIGRRVSNISIEGLWLVGGCWIFLMRDCDWSEILNRTIDF
jgi:hypothetical protein